MSYYKERDDGSYIHVPGSPSPEKKRPSLLPIVLIAVVLLGAAAFWVAPRFLDQGVTAPVGTPAEQMATLTARSAAEGCIIYATTGAGKTREEARTEAAQKAAQQYLGPSDVVSERGLPTSQAVRDLIPEARFVYVQVFQGCAKDEAAEGS